MTGPRVEHLVALLKAIGRLALPASAQRAQLRERNLRPSIDELALELHDMAILVPQFVAEGWLTPNDAAFITQLDQFLDAMSGPDQQRLWTEEALNTASEWEEVRRRAREVLAR